MSSIRPKIFLAALVSIVWINILAVSSTKNIDEVLKLADSYLENIQTTSMTEEDIQTADGNLSYACSRATAKLLPRQTVLGLVQEMFRSKCDQKITKKAGLLPRKFGCRFHDFGRALLQRARDQDLHLFTVQLGGMDGKSNDPMYKMFCSETDLSHWLPAVFEPVKYNFESLQKTYQEHHEKKSLSCSLLAQQAISDDPTTSTCTFCYFDNSTTAPESCQKRPDWLRLQLGTLECDESNPRYKNNPSCIIREDLPCRSLDQSIQQWGLSLSNVAILQVDVEGYEWNIFHGMQSSSAELPPVLHFEVKVLKERDQRNKTRKYEQVLGLLMDAGYVLFSDGEDALALLTRKQTKHVSTQ